MTIFLIILHVVVCVALIMIVLLQTGKGADMGAAFGGGSSQTLFGSTGASTFLSKATTGAAVVFMLTSLALAYLSSHQQGGSIITGTEQAVEQTATAPATPESTPAAPATQESTPAAPATQESTPAAPATQESAPAAPATQESAPAAPATQESTPAAPGADPEKTE